MQGHAPSASSGDVMRQSGKNQNRVNASMHLGDFEGQGGRVWTYGTCTL